MHDAILICILFCIFRILNRVYKIFLVKLACIYLLYVLYKGFIYVYIRDSKNTTMVTNRLWLIIQTMVVVSYEYKDYYVN